MARTVVVSGAGGSLGSKVVDQFLKSGFEVEGIYRSQPKETLPEGVHPNIVNLSDEEAVSEMVEDIISRKGSIEVLVCTAGGFAVGDVRKTNSAALLEQYRLNFLTAYHLARPVYLHMKEKGYGRIFLTGSRQGLISAQATGTVGYGLSKSLLFHLAEILNADNDNNVVTSMVVPSTIDTAANRKSMPDADFSKWVDPVKIADTILYYCSESGSIIREPVIRVFGES